MYSVLVIFSRINIGTWLKCNVDQDHFIENIGKDTSYRCALGISKNVHTFPRDKYRYSDILQC